MAMRIGLLACGWVSAASIAASPLAAQDKVVGDVIEGAKAPLRDLRIEDKEIPEVLLLAASAPYSNDGTGTCAEIASAIAAITEAMGPDADTPHAEAGEGAAAGAAGARAAMGTLIPGYGLVRVLTGATKHEQRVQAAIYGGAVRRAYLKGLGAARRCPRAAAPTMAAREAHLTLPPAEAAD
jgi:hypothetical protein